MQITAIAFYAFSTIMLIAGFLTVLARNPVHSVLWLILSFFSAAGLFVLLGAEFLAMLLLIVYVGAVAVLFLFVVMMLDVDFATLRAEVARYLPFGLVIAVLLIMVLTMAFSVSRIAEGTETVLANPIDPNVQNTVALGQILYTKHILLFQLAGLILLVAMIGAIVLTLRHRADVKRQNVTEQILRDPARAIELKDVKPRQGLL